MNPKIRFNTLVLFLVVSLIACNLKKERSTPKLDIKPISTPIQSNLSESDYEQHDVNPGPINPATYIYDVVEQMPQFPGGQEKMLEFIAKNLKYPAIANESCVQGRTIVRFVVTRKGKLQNFVVIRSLDPAFDNEALRVLKMMPRWIPGKQNGVNVNVYYTLPISFKLE